MSKTATAIFITILLIGTATYLYLNALSNQENLNFELEDEDVSSYC
ncbi:MAG: hypothetical protein M3Q05_12435 [Bacteroidota bacterium]|nr:hypothetical protein [Bacteroidota bacterium]